MISCMPQTKRQCGAFSLPVAMTSMPQQPKRSAVDNFHGEIDPISHRLNELSMEERSKLEYELHGVDDVEKETPAMVETKMMEMDQALESLVAASASSASSSSSLASVMGSSDNDEHSNNMNDTFCYQKAVAEAPDYVNKLKLACLRSETFHSDRAAARLIRFFHLKNALFGQDKLGRDILLEDLSSNDLEALNRGLVMLLPQRDRSGRAIFVVNGIVNQNSSTETVMRLFYYVMMMTIQDVGGAQKRGIVAIYYGYGQTKTYPGRPLHFWKSWRALPVRIVASHFCGDGTILNPAARQFFFVAERLTVCRFRCHYGPQIECMYKLMTFGIPVNEVMPIQTDGSLDLRLHRVMVTTWQHREAKQQQEAFKATAAANATNFSTTTSTNVALAATTSISMHPKINMVESDLGNTLLSNLTASQKESPQKNTVKSQQKSYDDNNTEDTYVIPGTMDILMGKGRQPKSSPGALKLHDLLYEYRLDYDDAPKFDKAIVCEKILSKLKAHGVRFIRLSPGGFEICEDKVALDRISHGFRNLRSKQGRELQKRQQQLLQQQQQRGNKEGTAAKPTSKTTTKRRLEPYR